MKHVSISNQATKRLIAGIGCMMAFCAVLLAGPLAAHAASLTGTYSLVPGQTETGFSVRVLGGRPVTGNFANVSGELRLNEAQPSRSRVTVTVDLRSVTTPNNRITGFLKSAAMFNVAKHPIARFQSTRVRITGGDTAEVEGILVMRGKQQRTKLNVKLTRSSTNGRVAFEVSGGFFRSLYGMDAGLPIYGDKVNLKINATGRRS